MPNRAILRHGVFALPGGRNQCSAVTVENGNTQIDAVPLHAILPLYYAA
jgi:hypothetical protein